MRCRPALRDDEAMKIATFNVNGIKTRLPHLLQWLEREQPDVACLQELKALDEHVPAAGAARCRLPRAVARASARGTAWRSSRTASSRWRSGASCRAIRSTSTAATSRPRSTASSSPASTCPTATRSPGPKFDYKLAWFERLIEHADGLLQVGASGGAGRRLQRGADRLRHLQPALLAQGRAAAAREPRVLPAPARRRAGSTRSGTCIPDEPVFTFWDYFRKHWDRDAGLRIDHLLLNAQLAPCLVEAGVDRWVRGAGEGQRPCADLDRAGFVQAGRQTGGPAQETCELKPGHGRL